MLGRKHCLQLLLLLMRRCTTATAGAALVQQSVSLMGELLEHGLHVSEFLQTCVCVCVCVCVRPKSDIGVTLLKPFCG